MIINYLIFIVVDDLIFYLLLIIVITVIFSFYYFLIQTFYQRKKFLLKLLYTRNYYKVFYDFLLKQLKRSQINKSIKLTPNNINTTILFENNLFLVKYT